MYNIINAMVPLMKGIKNFEFSVMPQYPQYFYYYYKAIILKPSAVIVFLTYVNELASFFALVLSTSGGSGRDNGPDYYINFTLDDAYEYA